MTDTERLEKLEDEVASMKRKIADLERKIGNAESRMRTGYYRT